MKITGTRGVLSCICVLLTFLQSFNTVYAFTQRLLGSRSLVRHKRQVYVPNVQAGFAYANRTFISNVNQRIPNLGPWGPWTESSACSRTCGGGVAYQERICLDARSDGRHSCVGTSRRYFSCNTEDCPQPTKDFRGEQCARFNSVPYKEIYYSWLPYHNNQNPCELYCMPQGGSFYARLDRRVIDGTRCRDDGSLDVCVDAQCMPVGCDRVLGSTTKEDECRVCGGDGSSCRFIHGVFDENNFELGYNDILLIPVGATSVLIQEVQPSTNYLALRNAAGIFFLNGNWKVEFAREIKVAGTVFQYERKQRGYQKQEILRSRGPTSEPIYVVLLYQSRNPGISYEYSIPVTTKTSEPDSYSWTFGDFEECSKPCGGGVQYRPVRCIKETDRDIVDEKLCDPLQKPSVNGTCNTQPCPSGWHIGEWSVCSQSCSGGTQFRLVFCHQSTDGTSVVLPDETCEEEKPLFMRACNTDTECPDWMPGEWSECDRSCGNGNQTRTVECSAKGAEEPLEDSLCNSDERPTEVQTCNLGPCEGVEWIVSDWSGCEGSCSPHVQSREVHCANEEGIVFPNDACEVSKMPSLTQPCPKSSMCEPMWHTSEWTECSVNCGNGVQSRVVFCGVWEEDSVIKIDEDKCDAAKKFEDVQNCSSEACAGTWFTGPWNRCSVPCGGGERTRKILCFHEEEVVDADKCIPTERPFATESCNVNPCDDDEIMVFGGCKDSKHGCCPDGLTPAGFNDEDCPKMDITSTNSTCEEAEFGCCADNFTLALGPFRKGCPSTTPCNSTQHGCCPDLVTPATGPDFEGCGTEDGSDCANSTFGCCSDGLTAATGPEFEGCGPNVTDCENSTFGCCSDGLAAATGPGFEGCDNLPFPEVESSGDGEMNETSCQNSTFGCCEDGMTFAKDAVKSGCFEDESSGDGELPVPCDQSTFGCCPDNVTLAKGIDGEGCEPEDCSNSTFGCCPDNSTSATGLDNEGCFPEDCSNSTFGCCPDNFTSALGPDGEGCFPEDCSNSTFGCCPDNSTSASGPDNEGCFPEDCSNSTFGCCPDNSTSALGPDSEGCFPEDCSNSTFGCCPDNSTSASGPNNEGCEPTDCSNTTFGCCPDNSTTAIGPEYEGCDDDDEDVTNCTESEFGCCEDNVTSATGENFEGCNVTDVTSATPDVLTTTDVVPACVDSKFGCCPDEITTALGPNLEGCCFGMRFGCCPDNKTAALGPTFLGCGCQTYPYKCCPDDITPAQGFNYVGCKCEHFRYGCCQDKVTPASGPHFEGCVCHLMEFGCCPDGRTPMTNEQGEGCGCDSTRYGCCPDGITAATSPDLAGCPCTTLQYGCCPDGFTPARTPDLRECPCSAQRYGCCLDETTAARGPNFEGCPCITTRFGCCLDGQTAAQGPNLQGCPCDSSLYGCCADGYTSAQGPKYEGCPDVQKPKPKVSTEVCSLPKESGPCRNFSIMWHFDLVYGSCSRFWYGGCDGNGNKFSTQEECEATCVKPDGPEACLLPKTVGSCNEKIPSWYYDAGSKQCEAFTYGGCLGNNNRFVTKAACEQKCINLQPITPVDLCSLTKDEGSCDSAVIRWYYNTDHSRCEQFYYRGCKGNANRFETRRECEKSCLAAVEKVSEEDVCKMPQQVGHCSEFRERWFYDYENGQCHRFLFSGCNGNENNFGSFAECESKCSKETTPQVPQGLEFKTEYCFLSADPGPCNQAEVNWYYDSNDGVCKEFYFGGCAGNQNRFKTRKECETSCFEAQDVCTLPKVKGPCSGTFTQWYYDHDQEDCLEFLFTGCQGNANRFNSKEGCYQKCKKDKLTTLPPPVTDDVCSLAQQPGPCLGYYRMWYYDNSDNNCKSFVYGGCEGNGNRFEKRTECEVRCVKKSIKVTESPPTEPPTPPQRITNEDVCRLPVEPGPCNEAQPRWFYDAQTQSCLPFVFGGCGGNKNRFKTSEICLRFCSGIRTSHSVIQEFPIVPLTTTLAPTTQCPPSNCANLQCPYGIEESFDTNGCTTCRCSNPCEVHECPDGSRCAIDVARTARGIRTEPVCRRVKKPGECPSNSRFSSNAGDCETRCRDDADCRGEHKCCHNGCAFNCVPPADELLIPATQPEQARIRPGVNVTEGRVGEPAELPCDATGWPRPTVTWWRETTMLPLTSHRYEQLSSYALLIRSVVHEDAGDYSCHAHNGIGSGAIYKVTLVIDLRPPSHEEDFSARDSEPLPDFAHSAPLQTRVTLATHQPKVGSPLQVDCSVEGPSSGVRVSWTRDGEGVEEDDRRRVLSNYTLFITKAVGNDTGDYRCTAEHSGLLASSSVYVSVEASEDSDCVDNPQFQGCPNVVRSNYCNNKYYRQYCCASCLRAEKLRATAQ